MLSKTNLLEACQKLTTYWSPKILGRINDQYVKVARLKGTFVWHDHAEEDELFYVLKGSLTLHYEDQQITLTDGDMHIVPKGVRHKPVAEEDCYIALIEPVSTKHTGDQQTPLTRSIEEQGGQ